MQHVSTARAARERVCGRGRAADEGIGEEAAGEGVHAAGEGEACGVGSTDGEGEGEGVAARADVLTGSIGDGGGSGCGVFSASSSAKRAAASAFSRKSKFGGVIVPAPPSHRNSACTMYPRLSSWSAGVRKLSIEHFSGPSSR